MLKRIAAADLRVGMYLNELCGSWMEHPFWRRSFALTDPKDIQRILDCGVREAWIDTDRGADIDAPLLQTAATVAEAEAAIDREFESLAARPAVVEKRAALTEELARAKAIYAGARPALLSMYGEARMGRAIDSESVSELVEQISSSVLRNPGALISLSRLRRADDYTYMHSAAVCALMISLARQLGCDPAFTREAGLAGMLHDLGKARMPGAILRKPGALTDAEFAQMRTHARMGFEMLAEQRGVGELQLDVCLHHHEKVDGSGYPEGLSGGRISLISKMAAVCDVYDAITSNRPYRMGWPPAEAVRKMAEWEKGHFDGEVFRAFLRTVGIYPVGSLVRLACGRLGVVIENNENALLRPVVKVFFSTRAQVRIAPEIINLCEPSCNNKIVAREDAARWGLSKIDAVWAGDALNVI